MKKSSIATVGTVMLALGVGSSANALTLTSSSGIWTRVNTTDPALRFQTVGNENQVRWGIPARPSTEQTGLGFTGVTNTNFDLNETFVVGTLRHFNREHPNFARRQERRQFIREYCSRIRSGLCGCCNNGDNDCS